MGSFPKIITNYELPFTVLAQPAPLLSNGDSIILSMEMQTAPSEKTVGALKHAMMHFSTLAETGAMGGDTIPPWESTLENYEGPRITGPCVEWTLVGCRLDERALALLVNLFLVVAENAPLNKLEIKIIGDPRPCIPLKSDPKWDAPYPPCWKQIPFNLDVYEEAMESLSIGAEFTKNLTKREREDIENELLSWAGPASEGAYAIAPVSPTEASMMPDFPISIDDHSLDWSIEKCRADRGALDGLVNVLVAIHKKIAPIREVTIE